MTRPGGRRGHRGRCRPGAVSRSQDVAIRRLAERDHNIVHWTEFERGGHFAALEAPEFLVIDIRHTCVLPRAPGNMSAARGGGLGDLLGLAPSSPPRRPPS